MMSENKVDPTKNVRELVEASIKRLDDIANIRATSREKYVDDKFNDVSEKFKDKDVQYQLQFTSAKEAVSAALYGTREAINKAEATTDKRFDLLSEKIDGIAQTISRNTGERGIYVTHTDLNIAMDKLQSGIEATLRPVVTFMNSQNGKSSGLNAGWVYLIGMVSLSGTIISIFHAMSE